MKLREIIEKLKQYNNVLIPCTTNEVNSIEENYKIILPREYRNFLLCMGKGAGRFLKGDSCFYNEIFDLKEGAEEIIQDNELDQLPELAFVFWMHQGYQFAYFICDGICDDPEVYFFSENTEQIRVYTKYSSFTNFLSFFLNS